MPYPDHHDFDALDGAVGCALSLALLAGVLFAVAGLVAVAWVAAT